VSVLKHFKPVELECYVWTTNAFKLQISELIIYQVNLKMVRPHKTAAGYVVSKYMQKLCVNLKDQAGMLSFYAVKWAVGLRLHSK
jgi:hypothetical protein